MQSCVWRLWPLIAGGLGSVLGADVELRLQIGLTWLSSRRETPRRVQAAAHLTLRHQRAPMSFRSSRLTNAITSFKSRESVTSEKKCHTARDVRRSWH